MSVRWDPLLARILAREMGRRFGGRRVLALGLDRERRVAWLAFEDAPALLFLLHPEAGQVVPGPKQGGGERAEFRRLFLSAVSAPPDERLLFLELSDAAGRLRHRIAVELHTNQWNLLLLAPDGDGERIRHALWPREAGDRVLRPGRAYAAPAGSRTGRKAPLSPKSWIERLAPLPPERRRRAALRKIAWLSSVNVGWVLGRASETSDGEALAEAHARYRRVWEALPPPSAGSTPSSAGEGDEDEEDEEENEDGRGADDGQAGAAGTPIFLLERQWGLQPYPLPLGTDGAEPRPSLLAALEETVRRDGIADRVLDPEAAAAARREARAQRLREALTEREDRLERKREALERERKRGADPARLRSTGNLLLARLDEVPRGASRVRLADFDGGTREVELDPALEPTENAEAYFEEAARRERALERIPREIARTAGELERVRAALDRLEEEGPTETLWEIAGGRPEEERGGATGETERLPYLRLRSSGGMEVRVGTSARSNDELTFHHSSPEDIWLHARQVQGAHAILRWGHREGNPPRRDLLEAAVAAAVHSGARHSGTVAVDWTRRKYVRKPRKAPPGAVVPDRVQTLFVEPDADLVDRMKRRAEAGGEG